MTDGERGPIESATAELAQWLTRTVGEPVWVGPPADAERPGLSLWPLALRPETQLRGAGRREPYRFGIRYLITVGQPASLGLLDRLLRAAAVAGEPAVSLDAGDPRLWRSFGVAPRPAVFIDIAVQIDRPLAVAAPVTRPLSLRQLELTSFTGRVVGPGEQPVASMRVEVLDTQYATHTDDAGWFTVPGVPAGAAIRLRLRGRGHVMTAEVNPADDDIVIHCEFPRRPHA